MGRKKQKYRKTFNKNSDYEIINGRGVAHGNLIGGCMESLNNLRGTDLFPTVEFLKQNFIPRKFRRSISTLAIGTTHTYFRIYGNIKCGIGDNYRKTSNNINYDEYKDIWKKMAREWKIYNTPIFYNASFGHNEPKCIIPFGAFAKLDTNNKTFHILENSCI